MVLLFLLEQSLLKWCMQRTAKPNLHRSPVLKLECCRSHTFRREKKSVWLLKQVTRVDLLSSPEIQQFALRLRLVRPSFRPLTVHQGKPSHSQPGVSRLFRRYLSTPVFKWMEASSSASRRIPLGWRAACGVSRSHSGWLVFLRRYTPPHSPLLHSRERLSQPPSPQCSPPQ